MSDGSAQGSVLIRGPRKFPVRRPRPRCHGRHLSETGPDLDGDGLPTLRTMDGLDETFKGATAA